MNAYVRGVLDTRRRGLAESIAYYEAVEAAQRGPRW
jgi:hypothetical protein